MSENNTLAKVYVNSIWVDQKTFDDGGFIIKLGIKADELIEFLQKNKNEKGRVNLVINKKKGQAEEGKSQFYTTLDTWQLKAQSGQVAPKVQSKPVVKKTAPAPEVDNDDNMF